MCIRDSFRTIRAQQKRIQQERAEAARKFAASQSDRAAAERAKVEQTQREIDEIRARTQRPSRDEWAAVADPGGFDAEGAPAARSPLRPKDAAAVAATRARADAAGAQLDEEARRLAELEAQAARRAERVRAARLSLIHISEPTRPY